MTQQTQTALSLHVCFCAHLFFCTLSFTWRAPTAPPPQTPALITRAPSFHTAALLLPQRQRLIRAQAGPEEGAASGEEGTSWGRENGTGAEGDGQHPTEERGKETESGKAGPQKEEEDDEGVVHEEEEEDDPFKPFVVPGN